MVEFRYEPLDYLLKTGLPALAQECFDVMDDKFGRDLYAPNWREYSDMEENKNLGFVAMREDDVLIGYAAIEIISDIHQKGLRIALMRDIFITEKKRGHAIKFFNYIKDFVKQLGAWRLDVAERLTFDASRGGVGKFYEFMGGERLEVIWSFKVKE
jgi:hypothetical protein